MSKPKNAQYHYNIFNKTITSFVCMSENITNTSKIKFSNIDFSKVTWIRRMFSGSSLIRVVFRYLNASSLNNMEELFLGCNNLKEVSYFNLDTSKVITMKGMFNIILIII